MKISNVRAMTVVEVLVASSVLSIGAAAILGGYSTLMNLVEHQRRLEAAVHITQGRAEELLATHCSRFEAADIATEQVVTPLGRPIEQTELVQNDRDNYRLTWSWLDNEPIEGFMRVTVMAQWNEARGLRTTQVTLVKRHDPHPG